MNNTQKGTLGEKLAAVYLQKNGYKILCKNYRYGRYEIDLITCKENTLHFVEVKLRTDVHFGYPEEAVTAKKSAQIRAAAEQYIFETQWLLDISFDILAIQKSKNSWLYTYFEDAF